MVSKTTDKILLIDDDPMVRQNVAAYLEDGGFEIVEATNGEEGINIFKKEKPDLVLVDLQMPGMPGDLVLDSLTLESPQTPTVVMSEEKHMSEIIDALKHGATDYVMKPITDMTVLEHAIAKALERSRLVEQNRIYREQLEIANQALKKNLDILEQDQEAGRSVQMRLLPEQDKQFGSYQFTHGVLPSLYLSGDFVDYFNITDTQFGFYIADVSGHGASSAFVTVLLKSLVELALTRFKIHDEKTILEPEKLLEMLGKEIHGAKLGKYLTIVYGVIDIEANTLNYSIGGHYPNPIWKENGTAKFMEGKGFPVGIMKQATYQRQTVPFPPGVQIVMFSDGITEILPEKDLKEKEERILSMVANEQGTVESFTKCLGLEVKRALPDDITMLILKRDKG